MKLLNNSGLSNIYLIEVNKYFNVYKFDTILGTVRIENSRQGYHIDFGISKYLKDDNGCIVHFWCVDEALKRLVIICDTEVKRLTKYLK